MNPLRSLWDATLGNVFRPTRRYSSYDSQSTNFAIGNNGLSFSRTTTTAPVIYDDGPAYYVPAQQVPYYPLNGRSHYGASQYGEPQYRYLEPQQGYYQPHHFHRRRDHGLPFVAGAVFGTALGALLTQAVRGGSLKQQFGSSGQEVSGGGERRFSDLARRWSQHFEQQTEGLNGATRITPASDGRGSVNRHGAWDVYYRERRGVITMQATSDPDLAAHLKTEHLRAVDQTYAVMRRQGGATRQELNILRQSAIDTVNARFGVLERNPVTMYAYADARNGQLITKMPTRIEVNGTVLNVTADGDIVQEQRGYAQMQPQQLQQFRGLVAAAQTTATEAASNYVNDKADASPRLASEYGAQTLTF